MTATRWALVQVLAIALSLSGCAATRSTIDVPVGAAASQPTAKGFVKITAVRDMRHFEAKPRDPSTPSLENPEEIKDRAITSRAIARKRGGYGNAMADILLPEGRTVELVVRETVTRALTEQGYTVVDAKSPDFERALPLQVDIDQFWAWFTPGVFQVQVEFLSVLAMRGDAITGNKQETARGYAIVKGLAITDSEWREVVVAGVADLTKNLRAALPPAK